MQRLALLALAAACGTPAPRTPAAIALPPAIAAYPAARWVPDRPTYVLAAHTLADAQAAVSGALDTLGISYGSGAREVSQMLQSALTIDPLSPNGTAALGIDGDGGFAVFSEGTDPTFVVHLAAPDLFTSFIDHLRQAGVVTQSVPVDGVELVTTSLGHGAHLSWAIDQRWLWVHLRFDGPDDTTWFTHSRHAASAPWAGDLAWAEHAATKALIGWLGARELVAQLTSRVPDAIACAKMVEPIRRVGIGLAAGGIRLAVDLGPSARDVEQHVLPPPPGWAAVVGGAPLAAQWNLDLEATLRYLTPCTNAIGMTPGQKLQGIRAARAILQTFDPDGPSGSGVFAADASSTKLFATLLDQIPMRSHLESARKFGPLAGHRLSIPFKGSIDYVLQDHLAIAAIGDGLLDRVAVASGAPAAAPPLVAIDLAPPKLSAAAWTWLIEAADLPRPKKIAEYLHAWGDAHLTATIERDDLVIQLTGTRR